MQRSLHRLLLAGICALALPFLLLTVVAAQGAQPADVGATVVIGAQDFNGLSAAGAATGDSVADGQLLTNSGSGNGGGGGLDFVTRWHNTRGEGAGPVLAVDDSGDYVGVNGYAGGGAPDVAPDGTPVAAGSEHNFEFNDADGRLDLVFEPVDTTGYTGRALKLAYWINADSYEEQDRLTVRVSDGITSATLLDLDAAALNAAMQADDGSANWASLDADLEPLIASGLGAVMTLTVSVDNNSGNENIFIDDVAFVGRDQTPTAPTVVNTSPISGALEVALTTTVRIDFSTPVTVTAPVTAAFALACPAGAPVAVTASGGVVQSATLTPTVALPPSTTCQVTVNAAQIVAVNGGLPMAADYVFRFTTGDGSGVTPIHTIQGTPATQRPGGVHDDKSPLEGRTVTVRAVVVGDFQGETGVDDDKLDGFFLQEEDVEADNDPASSEGIFVYCAACPVDVQVGQIVTVTGEVGEFFGMTQINARNAADIAVADAGNRLELVTPTSVDLPVVGDVDDFYETHEGMLVSFADTMVVSEYFELARYGQLILTESARMPQFTHANAPDAAGYAAHLDELSRRRIILDDDNNVQNDALFNDRPAFWPRPGFSVDKVVRGGSIIRNLTGVLHWSFAGQSGTDAWRVRPVEEAFSYDFAHPVRDTAPNPVGGNVKVASFNVLNYFDGDGAGGGFPTSRGAHSPAEFERQTAKIVAALTAMDADVVGLMEIENDGGSALGTLVGALNTALGVEAYAYVDAGVMGTDEIAVGLIYKTATVQPLGAPQVLDAAAFTDPNDSGSQRNRPALAQSFVVSDTTNADTGEIFTVVVNHLKSKGSGCGAGDDDPERGQGNCNGTRTGGALALVDWLALDPTGSGDGDVLIIGDLNSYAMEDPITALKDGGYTNLIDRFGGVDAYSYVFDGQLGYLDHALGSATLTPQVTGVTEWHINADEVNLLDYNDTVRDDGEASYEPKPAATELYRADPYRASDHDPVVVGLDLGEVTRYEVFLPVAMREVE